MKKSKCKSKKAEINMVGIILIAFVGLVVGLALFQAIIKDVGTAQGANPVTAANVQVTGILNTAVELTGQELISVEAVTNRTTGADVPAVNYTVYECVKSSSGYKGICYKALSTCGQGGTGCGPVNVSYTYYPDGYVDNAGGRSMAGLIAIFAALAIAVIALSPVLKSGLLEMMGR